MPLLVSCADHHFASSKETTRFQCRPPEGKKIEELKLEITDRAGTVVYKYEWTSGTIKPDGKYPWDGENTEAIPVKDSKGKPKKQYVTPLGSPYTAKFRAKLAPAKPAKSPPSGVSASASGGTENCPLKKTAGPPDDGKEYQDGSATVQVLYREVKLVPITWPEVYQAVTKLSDTGFPEDGTFDQQKTWLVCKLNELGFPAGAGQLDLPLPAEPILRTLFRYTQTHPELPKIYEFKTLEAGAAGNCSWGWRPLWEAVYGTLAEFCQGGVKAGGDDLLNRLQADELKRADTVEKVDALTDVGKKTRVILDHDLYYFNREWDKLDAHAEYDKEFLNPFCAPFRAVIRLVSQKDSSATKDGVDAPEAIGNVQCDWIAFDPPEDFEPVPPPTKAKVTAKSKTRGYLDQTHRTLAGAYGDSLVAFDNCPSHLGGGRPADPGDMTPYFDPVIAPETFAGSSVVLFKGSYVAGDNYVIQARLSLDNVDGAVSLKALHKKLRGLANSFGAVAPYEGSKSPDPLVAQSGGLTIWRRQHVLRVLRWGTVDYPEINWSPIVENFRAAHTILVPPAQGQIHVKDLFDAATQTELRDSLVAPRIACESNSKDIAGEIQGGMVFPPAPLEAGKVLITSQCKEFRREAYDRRTDAAFRPECLFPLTFPTLDRVETLKPTTQTGEAERYEHYKGYLQTDLGQWPKFEDVRALGLTLRKAFDRLKTGPGIIVLRAQYFAPPDFQTLLPPKIFKATRKQQAEFSQDRGICAGIDYGIVMIDPGSSKKYEEAYLVSHEIAHCLFATHPFALNTKSDHDPADVNCLMNYNLGHMGNGLISEGWGVKSAPKEYKLTINLQGDTRLDSVGTLSGKFEKKQENGKVDHKNYLFTGSLKDGQKAVRGVKFSPDRSLGPDYKVQLTLDSPLKPGLEQGAWPVTKSRKNSEGAFKPFGDLVLKEIDLKGNEPRFCGKCVLKLRGWRTAQQPAATDGATPDSVPDRTPPPFPVRPQMTFVEYQIKRGAYKAAPGGEGDWITIEGPFSFVHVFKLTWESSDGNLEALADVQTRERITFRHRTQVAPFSDFADPDQDFAQIGDNGDKGSGFDDHSVRFPALICAYPRVAGTLIGEQWYQYKRPEMAKFENIEGAAYLLEKTVYFNGKDWVLKFKKSNWAPHNTVPFAFEAHYRINPPPSRPAHIGPYMHKIPTGDPYLAVGGKAYLFRTGDQSGEYKMTEPETVDIAFLKRHGYLTGSHQS